MKILLIFLFFTTAYADGKFYYADNVNRDIPYQRAIMLYDENQETLVVQSAYYGVATDIQWIIPTPSLPEVTVLPGGESVNIFYHLGGLTQPNIIPLSFYGFIIFILIVVIFLARFGFLIVKPRKMHGIIFWKIYGVILLILIISNIFYPKIGAVLLFYLFFITPLLMVILAHHFIFLLFGFIFTLIFSSSVLIPAYMDSSVRSYAQSLAGPYDIEVITADTVEDITLWLEESGFTVTEKDKLAFDHYIKQNWYFVTAKVIKPEKAFYNNELTIPLILKFSTKIPIYPLILTGTTAKPTQLDFYTFGRYRFDSILPTVYAHNAPIINWSINDKKYAYLTKFSGVLTAEMMEKDLVLTKASDNKAFQLWYFDLESREK